jgi:RNA polymerase sigma-70 factor (ECF subfamily)
LSRRGRWRLGDLSDRDLAALAAGGDADALDHLLRRHHELVYRVCRRLCLQDADALDATQESLIRVARRIDRFDGRAAFTTWLYRVVTNACLDELRRQRRRPVTVPLDAHPDSRGGNAAGEAPSMELPSPDPDLGELAADRLDLDDALRGLPEDFRAAVVLRDVVGLDYAAIGQILDIPPGTVRSRIARGRAHLARALAPTPPPPKGRGALSQQLTPEPITPEPTASTPTSSTPTSSTPTSWTPTSSKPTTPDRTPPAPAEVAAGGNRDGVAGRPTPRQARSAGIAPEPCP